jgi:hypothetical protein
VSLRWDRGGAAVHEAQFDGRHCLRLDAGLDGPALATVADVELLDGAFEVERARLPPRRPRAPGRLGVLVAGEGLLFGGLTYDANMPLLAEPPEIPASPG